MAWVGSTRPASTRSGAESPAASSRGCCESPAESAGSDSLLPAGSAMAALRPPTAKLCPAGTVTGVTGTGAATGDSAGASLPDRLGD
jgi:hypothetical protein